MKRRRPHIELTDDQQLMVGILLVLLVALSVLYCLGLSSLFLHSLWESGLPASNGTQVPLEELPLALTPVAPAPTDVVPIVP